MVSGTRLLRALRATARPFGLDAEVELVAERPWASATYVGAQHVVRATATSGAGLDAWLAALPELTLPMPGQFADVSVTARDDQGGRAAITIEALTLAA